MSIRATTHTITEEELESGYVTGYSVLIEVESEEEVTIGGLHSRTPDEAEKRGACRGVIRQVGPLAGRDHGETPENWGAEVGNTVLFPRYDGDFIALINSPRRFIVLVDKGIMFAVKPKKEV